MDNYIKDGNGGAWAQCVLCERQTAVELAGDYSLPDYQPEIKRLLRVKATVMPPDSYVGAGSAEFSGVIHYSILYAGNDGALYSVNQSDEYRFAIPVEMTSEFDPSQGVFCQAELLPETVGGRVAAPRRLSVKCRLRAMARILGMKQLCEPISKEADGSTQRLLGSVSCARVYTGAGESFRLGDEILCEGSDDLRVIHSEGQVFVTEAVAGSECVNCRGEVSLKLLVCREGSQEPPSLMTRRIPFAQLVELDGARVDCEACAYGVCNEVNVTVEEGRILADLGARLSVRAQRNETVPFTRDLYSTRLQTQNTYITHALPVAGRCLNGNFSVNTAIPLSEAGIRREESVVDVSMIPVQLNTECDKGRLILTGKCRCHVILLGKEEYGAQELEIPFRYETEVGCDGAKDLVSDATVTVISCRGRMDGERIGLDAELAVCLATRTETQVQVLSQAHFGEAVERSASVCTVCYPCREDTLWSVAKRYHQPVELISARNGLSDAPAADTPASLSGVLYLLV